MSALIAALQRVETGSVEMKDQKAADASLEGIQKIIIKEALASARENIEEWQKAVEESVEKPWEKLNACFVDREAGAETILENIHNLSDSIGDLLSQLASDEANSELLRVIGVAFKGKEPPYYPEVSDSMRSQLMEMICPYITIGTDKERPELVKIEPIDDDMFTPGIAQDVIDIHYSIESTAKFPLRYARAEIYDKGNSLVYVNTENIEIATDAKFVWDGKMNQGDFAGKYIRYEKSEFTIKILASVRQDYSDPFVGSTIGSVDFETDEWNDNKDMHGWVICDQCSESKKYETYRELAEVYESILDFEGFASPLEYFKNKITFDDSENKYTFLGKPVRVYKSFYPVLKELENYIVKEFGSSVFAQIKDKYSDRSLGGFAMRYINNGSSKSESISPHGMGLAVDIDWKRNPQVIASERPAVLFFIKRVTEMNFFKDAPMPSWQLTKAAHHLFLTNLSKATMSALLESLSKIQEHNEKEQSSVYQMGDISDDIINSGIKTVKKNIQNINKLIANNGDRNDLKLVFESIDNELFILDHKLSELESLAKELFNVLIFTPEGKSGIVYLTERYIPFIKAKLIDLREIMALAETERQKNNPDYSLIPFDDFTSLDFSINTNEVGPLVEEYKSFITEAKGVRSNYSNLENFAKSLQSQTNSIGYDNILLEDGFCDLDDYLLIAMLSDALKARLTEWGGQYNGKKDWMHFGVMAENVRDYID
ncbi:MAG: hypothetical protein RIB71_12655 [Imperialibacter sp.]|uniref:hypothetical protein n=1 Tax=Imperialibacter sp. TaxID=2038411 RepID=UPI0032EFBABA